MPPRKSPAIHQQLELHGLAPLREKALAKGDQKQATRLEAASRAALEPFTTPDSRAWTHPAFALAGLPHSRPESDNTVWHRQNGRLHLLVEPGFIIENGTPRSVGVPYGAMARLVLLYIQTHARADGTVPLGRSLSSWVKALGRTVNGGQRGSITSVREQMLRLARARISIHWTDEAGTSSAIVDQALASGMRLWSNSDPMLRDWHEELLLTKEFAEALKARRMPLADHAIAYLRGTSLGLDLYAFLAHRLPRIKPPEAGRPLAWAGLAAQFGAEYGRPDQFANRIRALLPDVCAVYPGAKVVAAKSGLCLWKSPAAVPNRKGNG